MWFFAAAAPAVAAEPADTVGDDCQHSGRGVRVLFPVPGQALHHGAAAECQAGRALDTLIAICVPSKCKYTQFLPTIFFFTSDICFMFFQAVRTSCLKSGIIVSVPKFRHWYKKKCFYLHMFIYVCRYRFFTKITFS